MRLLATRLTAIASAVKRLFSPASLFRNSEQGLWYDPSDFSTLFQDSAGTTPVTAVEQPVGLVLDKSKGLVLGAELLVNGSFLTGDTTGWTLADGTASVTAGVVTLTNVATRATLSQAITTVVGQQYRVDLGEISNGASSQAYVRVTSTNSYSGTLVAQASATSSNGFLFFTATTTTTYFWLANNSTTAGLTVSYGGVSVKSDAGNHGKQATAASRPVLKQDTNGKYYLFFDGVDDSLSTGSIDFTSTDKMTVFAGVRKLSDAASGMLLELSSNALGNNGAFYFDAPEDLNNRYLSLGRGNAAGALNQASTVGALVGIAPDTAVLTVTHDIAGDLSTIRRNAVAGTTGTGVKGTGNFGHYPLYIGRRGGTNYPFNGHLYSLIVRGAQSSDSQIISAESYVNSKTGAY
jgi:hypothetical protein